MKRFVTVLTFLLLFAACGAPSRRIQQPQPQLRDSLQLDTTLARIQSDSALARIVDSLHLADHPRSVCPMPVMRGDASNDTGMVPRPLRSGRIPRVPPSWVCYNPFFRDSA